LLSSCSFFGSSSRPTPPIIEQKWDVKSLVEKDKTYKLEEHKPVQIMNEEKPISFEGNWFVVSENLIKTHNENQDTVIKVLEKQKELIETNRVIVAQSIKKETNNMRLLFGVLGGSVILIVLVVLAALRRK
jgi:hypothetical protein